MIRLIPGLLADGVSLSDISSRLGVARTCIRGIMTGRIYKEFQNELQPLIAEALKKRRDPPTKTCTRCEQTFPRTEEFFCPNSRKARFESECKTCLSKRGSRQHQKNKLAALSHYSNGTPVCACCGEVMMEFLSIDHVNGGGGKHRKEIGSANVYRWLRRQGYPDGFRVLCHNCNQAMGNFGYCPHQTGTRF